MRFLQTDVEERLKDFFYGFTSGETEKGVKHLKLLVQATAPGTSADAIKFYAKDVGGKAEGIVKNEDGDEIQIRVADDFVANDFLLTANAARSGWTDRTATYAGRHVRIGATPLDTGGSATLTGSSGSHTLTAAEIAAHFHQVQVGNGSGPHNYPGLGKLYPTRQTGDDYNTQSTGGGGGHVHPLTAVANTPLYVDMKLFQKN